MTTKPPLPFQSLALAPLLFAVSAASQQPRLDLSPNFVSRQQTQGSLAWSTYSRVGDVYVLLADLAAGASSLFGQTFDLAFTPNVLALGAGVIIPAGTGFGFVAINPSALPAGVLLYLQFGSWNPQAGFASLLVSNVDSFAAFDGPGGIEETFDFPGGMTGVFDQSVRYRLQALPPVTRTVRPLPPQAFPFLQPFTAGPLNPSGARLQVAFRAVDMGAVGVPEQLTAVRWRPLFGNVVADTHPQFELRAAHTAAVPDYTIDPWSALPMFPNSGLSTQFAANPAGTSTTLFNGSYTIAPSSLLPSGYLPYPAPQQSFVYDGQSTLLLETLCSPSPGLGPTRNHQMLYLMVMSSAQPFGTVVAAAGLNGQPSPLLPATATSGTGGSYTLDWELEFVRTTSLAQSSWLFSGPFPNHDYGTPIVASFTPPGTSLVVEFRGALDGFGLGATAWSSNQDLADGLPFLQYRVRMTANATTGAVPWLDSLFVPVQ